jgi:aspartyl/asparaginyl-tRNA synthetase
MEYGREMQFFDKTNRLSQSGQLLAELILPAIED